MPFIRKLWQYCNGQIVIWIFMLVYLIMELFSQGIRIRNPKTKYNDFKIGFIRLSCIENSINKLGY